MKVIAPTHPSLAPCREELRRWVLLRPEVQEIILRDLRAIADNPAVPGGDRTAATVRADVLEASFPHE